jgi:folate-binding protein YgfZ
MLSEGYRALKEHAVTGAIAPRSAIGVRGDDRASFLHGLLTNDIQSLTPGVGCYAAWLTPQGRMLADLHVVVVDDMILLDVPAGIAAATLERLDRSLFSEDVQLSDLAKTLTTVWVHGPAAPMVLQRILNINSIDGWGEYRNARVDVGGAPAIVVRVTQLGVPGFGVYLESPRETQLRHELETAGVRPVDQETLEVARIEAGYPLFGIDMTEDTIPLEAGIEDRAISFTKGCYVGQEVIIRVLHRGHGRVARRLVGLRLGRGLPAGGANLLSGDRHIGWVTSAATSPQFGSIALGYVQRDFTSPGTRLEVEVGSSRVAVTVSDVPFRSG